MKIFGHNFFNKKNQLIIKHTYYKADGYGGGDYKSKTVSIEKFLKKARLNNHNYTYGAISTKFNGRQYPVYDLDNESKYNDFLELHKEDNYVIFRSSKSGPDNTLTVGSGTYIETRHYWAIVDEDVKSIKNYKNVNWHVINDKKYVKFVKQNNSFDLRFTYENLERKPIRIKTSPNLSKNFKLFIKTFENLIENEGLEISTLIEKNKDLITYYNRKKVLTKLTESQK